MTIYFAKMGEWIKIGYTSGEASKRIAQLQTGQPQWWNALRKNLSMNSVEFRYNADWECNIRTC